MFKPASFYRGTTITQFTNVLIKPKQLIDKNSWNIRPLSIALMADFVGVVNIEDTEVLDDLILEYVSENIENRLFIESNDILLKPCMNMRVDEAWKVTVMDDPSIDRLALMFFQEIQNMFRNCKDSLVGNIQFTRAACIDTVTSEAHWYAQPPMYEDPQPIRDWFRSLRV